jgi:ceramide glucosyltransferase
MAPLLSIAIAASIVFYLVCAFCTLQFFLSKEEITDPPNPPVSIMVPVRGVDAGAWENWSSLCTQNYSDYEVLFGVTNSQDSAIPLLEQLVATYPERVRLFRGLRPRGANYEDGNLSYLLEESQHEVIIFADSNIRVQADYIRTVIAPLVFSEVGLVTCAFMGHNPKSLGAALASFGRCLDFIPGLLIARIIDGGLRFAVGATIATRKTTLANYGGLHLDRIGSDYNLGKRAARAGYRVELSRYVVESDTGKEGMKQVFKRELRWARTFRFNRGAQYYMMLLGYGTVYSLLLLLVSGFAPWAMALTLITWLVRYIQGLVSIFSIRSPKLLIWLWALPLRDVLSVIVWAMGAFGQEVIL